MRNLLNEEHANLILLNNVFRVNQTIRGRGKWQS